MQKMSKSLENYVGIHEDPDTMLSKVMTLPDDLILRYFTLVTDRLPEEILELEKRLETENPRDIKMLLAEEITAMYHYTDQAESARERFIRIFTKEEIPEDVKEVSISEEGFSLGHVLKDEGLVESFNEYKRLLSQNGISINGDKISSEESLTASGSLLVKVGKRKFLRILREAQ